MKDLDKLVEQVNNRESFLLFVKALIEDRELEVAEEKKNPSPPYGSGLMGWENGSIEDYLESSVAWTEDWIGEKA